MTPSARRLTAVTRCEGQPALLDASVYRAESDANTVLIVRHFSSLAEAHAFSESASLRGVISQSGVEEASRCVEFYEET
jgi:hypothetical protein